MCVFQGMCIMSEGKVMNIFIRQCIKLWVKCLWNQQLHQLYVHGHKTPLYFFPCSTYELLTIEAVIFCIKLYTFTRLRHWLVCNKILDFLLRRMVDRFDVIYSWTKGLLAVTVMRVSMLTDTLQMATCLQQSAWFKQICKLLMTHSHIYTLTHL